VGASSQFRAPTVDNDCGSAGLLNSIECEREHITKRADKREAML